MSETISQILQSINNSELRISLEKILEKQALETLTAVAALGYLTSEDISDVLSNPVNDIQFDLDPTIDAHQEGQVYWDADNNTLSIGMTGGEVELQVGQEHLIYAFNQSGSTIPNGSAVYIDDAGDSKPRIKLADADNTDPIPQAVVIGLTTEDIDHGSQGFVTTQGLVRGLNTSALTEGIPIWLSATTPGAYQDARPDAPDVNVSIGYCLYSHNNKGVMLVSPIVLPRVIGLSDVYGTPSNGDTIRWNATNERFEFGA